MSLTDSQAAKVQRVIDAVAGGEFLRVAIQEQGISPTAWGRLLQKSVEHRTAYLRAVEIKADLLADDVVYIADSEDDPQRSSNRMRARQWLASKLYAQRYGDRIDVNVTQTLDISKTLAEARKRVLTIEGEPAKPLALPVVVDGVDILS
jgi:hypothetical protein